MVFSNHRIALRRNLTRPEMFALQALLGYHLLFAFIFTGFLEQNGGDAIRFWELKADTSQEASAWMEYWGSRSLFIQWLNYLPSKVLNMSFMAGNFLYAICSFLGLRILYLALLEELPKRLTIGAKCFLFWILLFPNLHFWTSGVGKEALLFTAIIFALLGFRNIKKYYLQIIFGVALAWWVRPIFGATLILVFFLALYQDQSLSPLVKKITAMLSVLCFGIFVYQLTVMMHVASYDWKALTHFVQSQYAFLEGFAAASEIPMAEYSFGEKLMAMFFRPFWHEVNGFWYFVAIVENTTFLGVLIAAIYFGVKHKSVKIPKSIRFGLIFGTLLTLILMYSLNNFGIIMRMKSTYMIFFYITAALIIIQKSSTVDED